MRKFLYVLYLTFYPIQSQCLEKLDSDFLIRFGQTDASVQIVHYFSFTCPHCIGLYRKEFCAFQAKYLTDPDVSCIFHPVPMDLLTVQAMDCLEKLSEKEKRIFFSALFEIIPIDHSVETIQYMLKAMEIFEKPLPNLQDKEYLSNTRAFKEAFLFLKQEEKIQAVPAVEINGEFFSNALPTLEFIDSHLKQLLKPNEKRL